MPIELVDENGNELDLDKANGGTLRKLLEDALSANRSLEQEVVTARAAKAISENGYSLVKPEDLKGVGVDEVEAKAKQIHEEKLARRTETVKEILADKGLEGEALDQAVEKFLAGEPIAAENTGEVEPDFADLISVVGGERPSRTPNAPAMDDPMGNLTAAFED